MSERMDVPARAFTLRGTVFNEGVGPSAPDGLRVVAVDQEDGNSNVIVTATTKAGAFELAFTEAQTTALLQEPALNSVWSGSVSFHVSVFNGDVLLTTSSQPLTLGDLVLGQLPQVLTVDLTGTAATSFVVSGRVLDGRGQPRGGGIISLMRLDVGQSTSLGIVTADNTGAFSITYAGSESSIPAAPRLDLQLIAYDELNVEIGRTPVIFDPAPDLRIDIITAEAYEGRSEYARIEQALTDVIGDVAPHQLTAADLELVAKRAEIYPLHLAKYIQAARLAEGRIVGAPTFYALLRAELPAELPALLARAPGELGEALTRAYEENLISPPADSDTSAAVDAQVTALRALIVSGSMAPAASGVAGLREMLDVSGLPEAKLRVWMGHWLEHEGDQASFWSTVEADPTFTAAEVASLRFAADSGALTGRFVPAMVAIESQRAAGAVAEVADLVQWDVADWVTLLTPVGAPDRVPGQDTAEKVANYAVELNRALGERHPSRRLARRLERDSPAWGAGVMEFIDANPDFDIDTTVVAAYLQQNPGSLPGGFDPAQTESNLKDIQRIHRITPRFERYEVTRAILDAGFTSASQIVRLGKTGFAAAMAGALSGAHSVHDEPTLVGMLYGAAVHKHGMSVAVMSQYGVAFNTEAVPGIPALQFTDGGESGAATLADLFGSLDYCACEHCRSVFSPAAYLVDLLALLQGIPASVQPNALEVLRARRADIMGLELSCTNTNTVLPYIDLVTELLEQRVVAPAAALFPRQTTRSAAELRLDPEHRDDTAYDAPATAVFPWSLPVGVPSEELREYAQQLGVPRVEAMRTLRSMSGTPSVEDVAAEALGLTRQAAHVLSGDTMFGAGVLPTPVDAAWGMAGVVGFDQVLAGDLRQLLDRAGLDFDELVALLDTAYVDPGGLIVLDYAGGSPSCDLDDISLLNVTPAVLDRLHRFVRLGRVTGRPRDELLLTLDVLGGGTLDGAYLVALGDLMLVEQRLGLTPAEACTLWHDLSVVSYGGNPSVFTSIYQNPLLAREPDPAFDLVGSDLAGGVDLTASHHASIRAALGLNDADLLRLIDQVLPANPTLDVANLSTLYRHARLARVLRLSIDDLLRARALLADNPFQSPLRSIAFADAIEEIRASGTSIEQLDYLCRHQFSPDTNLHPTDERTAEVIAEITAGVAELEGLLTIEGEPEVLARLHLQAVFGDPLVVENWVRVLALGSLEGPDQASLEGDLQAVGIDPGWVGSTLVLAYPSGQHQATVDRLVAHRRQVGLRAVVASVLSAALGIDPGAAALLASEILTVDVAATPTSVHDVLVDATLLSADQSPGPEQVDAFVRAHKAAQIVAGLEIATADLSWYFGDPTAPQAMDLGALPLAPAASGTAQLSGWRRIHRGRLLQESFSAADNAIERASVEVDLDAAIDVLVTHSAWGRGDLVWATGPGVLAIDPANPTSLADPGVMERIRDAMDLVRRTGVDAEQIASWVTGEPDAAAARAARRALRARYDDSRWPDVIRPIADRLREIRRDALMATLLGRGDFADEAAVYEHFLVDPDMSACMLTSRVKLAISSAQLLVQRGLMHLEAAEFSVDPEVAERWDWMKNYRVWEANRKVFFYPQNWIEPELRDDKSPFFRELEQQLDQGDLTDSNVEQALKDYLYKLHDVSQLDVVAIHQELPPAGGQIVHVIGRTRGKPRRHFYRRRHDDLYWTPWEAVPLEMNDDQVLAAIHNRRLFLFWVEFMEERPEQEDGAGAPRLRVVIAWSEYRDGVWSPKHVSDPSHGLLAEGTGRSQIVLVSLSVGHTLFIDVVRDPGDGFGGEVFTTFYYDDCLDLLAETSPSGFEYSHDHLGKVANRRIRAQQQWTKSDWVGALSLSRKVILPELGYTTRNLITNARFHRVTLTHQKPFDDGLTPAVFDNGDHSLYIVPAWVYARVPQTPPGNTPVPLVVDPHIDDVVVAEPWGGEIPGVGVVVGGKVFSPSPAVGAKKILGQATQTVEAGITEWVADGHPAEAMALEWTLGYRLDPFHHPYTCSLRTDLNHHGIEGVVGTKSRHRRQLTKEQDFSPPGEPPGDGPRLTSYVAPPFPVEDFDFTFGGAYSVYNWELFFHVPLYIAERLRREQRFEQAQRWYHFVFDPLAGVEPGVDGPERFWNVKPLFVETRDGPLDVIKSIFSDDGLAGDPLTVLNFLASVYQWLKNPFSPHAIARVRSGTYRWTTLRKYLDNLLEWADSRFRRDTIESINEAMQLYVLAASILGPRPQRLPELDAPSRTYDELDFPALFGGLTELEGFLPAPPADIDWEAAFPPEEPPAPVWWYFCVPPNDQLLAYWDTVADRLFKIRHCQNIDGVTRQLPLFEPPIDPALLVKARAAGLDLSSVLDSLNAPMPHHRYRVLAARAIELCADVRSLGSALLQALEKKDAEQLSQLRAKHELALSELVKSTRQEQIREAEAAISVLDAQVQTVAARQLYYASKEKRSGREKTHLDKLKLSSQLMIGGQSVKLAGNIIKLLIPTIQAGTGFFAKLGGELFGGILDTVGDALNMGSAIVRNQAERQQINAGYDRRWEDWQFQAEQARLERLAINQQKVAAEIRVEVARSELRNHERQIEHSEAFELALRNKYTNDQLYAWMIGQVSALYFQSYKLAHEMAKKAERALQWELATSDSFVEFGYWDGLHDGLMAGERLQLDLRRMEAAYLDRNVREHEVTKRVSLRQLDPTALLDLRETGSCEFSLPEVLFDLDHPGHYMRRIKAVRLSIPAVVGPHTSLGAKLTLLGDRLRVSTNTGGGYAPDEMTIHEDSRFRIGYGGTSSIATSHGREDSGMFQLDFRDERFLPFEGTGAVSSWRLELPDSVRQFDYDSISDVEIQVHYTARDGGNTLRTTVESHVASTLSSELQAASANGLVMALSAKAAFPVEWERFLYPAAGQEGAPLEIPIDLERFAYVFRSRQPHVIGVRTIFIARDEASGVFSGAPASATITPPGQASVPISLAMAGVNVDGSANVPAVAVGADPWLLAVDTLTIDQPGAVRDLMVLVDFQLGA
ncbi:MAG: neuraminidase-like domain-containing protein [Myxococcota bacterium]